MFASSSHPKSLLYSQIANLSQCPHYLSTLHAAPSAKAMTTVTNWTSSTGSSSNSTSIHSWSLSWPLSRVKMAGTIINWAENGNNIERVYFGQTTARVWHKMTLVKSGTFKCQLSKHQLFEVICCKCST